MDPAELPLRDIHLPEAVSWWPPAPGWWILAVIAVVVAVIGLMFSRRWRAQRPIRKGLRLLEEAESLLKQGNELEALQILSSVLRRCAMTIEPELKPGLTGVDWLQWLDSRWSRSAFNSPKGGLLLTGPYQRNGIPTEDAADLLALGKAWVRAQRVQT